MKLLSFIFTKIKFFFLCTFQGDKSTFSGALRQFKKPPFKGKFWNFGHITIWHILPSARFFLLKNHSTLIFTIIFIAYPLIGRNRSQNSYCSGTNFRGMISQRSWALNCEILELGPYSIQKFDTTHKSSIFLSKKSLGFLLLQHGLLSSWELYLLG